MGCGTAKKASIKYEDDLSKTAKVEASGENGHANDGVKDAGENGHASGENGHANGENGHAKKGHAKDVNGHTKNGVKEAGAEKTNGGLEDGEKEAAAAAKKKEEDKQAAIKAEAAREKEQKAEQERLAEVERIKKEAAEAATSAAEAEAQALKKAKEDAAEAEAQALKKVKEDAAEAEAQALKKAKEEAAAAEAPVEVAQKTPAEVAEAEAPAAAEKKEDEPSFDWSTLDAELPTEKAPEARKKRFAIFKSFDRQGNGYLSPSELESGVVGLIDNVEKLIELRPVILRAYNATKGLKKSKKDGPGDDFVEKIEFRKFLVALRQGIEFKVMFDKMDRSGDESLTLDEFKGCKDHLSKWGVDVEDMEAEFKKLDQNGGGKIMFNEFANWANEQALDLVEDEEDNEPGLPEAEKKAKEAEAPSNPEAVEAQAVPAAGSEEAPAAAEFATPGAGAQESPVVAPEIEAPA